MEVKEVFEALNLPADIDSKEKLVETFRKSYIPLSEAHEDEEIKKKITGAIYGSLNTEAKRLFGLKTEDIEGKQFKDVLKTVNERYSAKLSELEQSAGKNNDEKFNTLKSEFEKINLQKSQYENDLQKLLQEKQNLEKNFQNELKQFKIESVYKEKKSKLPFADSIPEVAKVGFDSIIKSKYVIDFDEKGEPIVLDKEGKKIPKKDRAGEYLGLDEVFDMELELNGLKKKNNAQGGNVVFHQPNFSGEPAKPKRHISPRAIQHAQSLKQ